MLEILASNAVLDEAYEWLCHQRRHWPATSDVWSIRFHWETIKPTLQQTLRPGNYRFEPMSRITKTLRIRNPWVESKADERVLELILARNLAYLFGLVIIGVEFRQKASQVVHFRRAVNHHISA